MPEISKEEISKIMIKYKGELSKQLGEPLKEAPPPKAVSKEYIEFKKENLPKHLSFYEKACNFCERILKIPPSKQKEVLLLESINTCHLNVTPTGVMSFSFLFPIAAGVVGSFLSFILFALLAGETSLFFPVIFMFVALISIAPLGSLPISFANSWRMKASNQMVLCIFYVVTYMRHTSNIELAIEFASNHLTPPLSLDLKKVLWDVESEKYESVKESLDIYLEGWKKYNREFIESFHLIESSLYEGSDDRRVSLLDKGLSVMLNETFEKMLHYAHNLKSPITMLHMMGVILPILSLVILPLVVSFMEGIKWYHLATLYNVLLPIGVYLLGKNILSKRPSGYGDIDISKNPALKKYKNFILNVGGVEIKISPLLLSVSVAAVLIIIGLSPIILHVLDPEFDIDVPIPPGCEPGTGACFEFIGYKVSSATEGSMVGKIIGPFGLGASILSIALVLGVGLGFGLYYKSKSQNIIKIRRQVKKLETEFASALFQLGNRLGDGIPVEMAFGRVAEAMQGTTSGNFFNLVSQNIGRLGMGVEQAIFDPKSGALTQFPSNLIESSMKVLTESAKKGPDVAARALINISEYIKQMHKVDERLKDLLADIISSMKSQISFLTPVISGIVVGIASMVTSIIGRLSSHMQEMATKGAGLGGMGSVGVVGMFGDGVPTYYLQVVVGIYVVQIIFILTVLSNGIENGFDKLNERYTLGNNLIRSTIFYCVVAVVIIILFNIVAGQVMLRTLQT